MPFMSYQVSLEQALTNAGRMVKEGGFESVKLEGGREIADADELNEHPIHPYTESLLSAVPIPDPNITRARKRIVLEGVATLREGAAIKPKAVNTDSLYAQPAQ